ncbi:UNVERIFIED_CONTAM: hypothetical protein O8I53_07670 [Campylobacter lari]
MINKLRRNDKEKYKDPIYKTRQNTILASSLLWFTYMILLVFISGIFTAFYFTPYSHSEFGSSYISMILYITITIVGFIALIIESVFGYR